MLGTSQEQRSFAALNENYVKIDERDTAFLLSYTRELAAYVNFFNTNDELSGSWQSFFDAESVVWADMTYFDLPKLESEFQFHHSRMTLFKRRGMKAKHLKGIIDVFTQLFGKYDTWLTVLEKHPPSLSHDNNRKSEVKSALDVLLSEFRKLYVVLSDLESYTGTELELLSLLKSSHLPHFKASAALITSDSESLELDADGEQDAWQRVDKVSQEAFNTCADTFKYWKNQAKSYFENSLSQTGHKPHLALFKSFLMTFEEIKKGLNDLRLQHLNYYYTDVLKQRPKEAIEDHVYLFFDLNPHAKQAIMPENTLFLAGTDSNNQELFYKADQTAYLSHAKIKYLLAHFIDQGDTLLDLDNQPFWASGMYRNDLSAVLKERAPEPVAIFGESQASKGFSERNMQDAPLGFAFASPLLTLNEGEREISITTTFDAASFSKLENIITNIALKMKTRREELFLKIFLNAFTLKVAVPEGFMTIERYVVNKEESTNSLVFTFELGPTDPPLVPASPLTHDDWESEFPLVCFYLNNQAFIYAYNILEPLRPLLVTINTKTKGMRNIQVYSQVGKLNAGSPFQPFGSLPTLGSYLLIGNSEVTCKPLNNLAINITWFDLPRHKSGFYGYYEQYGLPIDNTTFEATLTVLNRGKWTPEESPQTFKLFSTESKYGSSSMNPKGTLLTTHTIQNIDTQRIKLSPDYGELNQERDFTSTSMRGFFKLELCSPYFGFGHDRYPSVLSDITIQNSKRSFLQFNKQPVILPNMPYTPQIQGITIDYEASGTSQIGTMSQEHPCHFYRIYPFGKRIVNENDALADLSLIPRFGYEGALHIGFEDLEPFQVVNVLLQLIDDFTTTSEEEPPELEWHYLQEDQWLPLSRKQLIEDSTKSFLETGIITLQTPGSINTDNQILHSGCRWFRVSAVKNVREAAKILYARAQVLRATAIRNEGATQPTLAPNSIVNATTALPGIQNIVQPFFSFGGRDTEQAVEFHTRIAERLRHKSRALSVWDYERMVLEKFPEIYKVRCVPHVSEQRGTDPSSVMILVIADPSSALNTYEPMASNSLLYQIKAFLQQRVSPFVNLDVRNPTYERFRIFASVKFAYGKNNGLYLQKLNEEIKAYLCSWLPPFHKGAQLGEAILRSDVLSFINHLPYVDFVTQCSILKVGVESTDFFSLSDTAAPTTDEGHDILRATHPWSVLTPMSEHALRLIGQEDEGLPTAAGVGILKIAEDFVILN